MERDKRINLYFLSSLIIVIFSGFMAAGYQTNFGTIDVQQISIMDEFNGYKVVGKLYRPVTATLATPAPAVLGLHGYNNDKDVQRPAAIELAKAGIVVLTIDELGHGDSEGVDTFYLQGADAAYKWLRTLSFVDGDHMGIYGHSMGYIVASQVAVMNPDHDACAFQTFPPFIYNFTLVHNVLHIWSQYEEWYPLPYTYITGTLPTPAYTIDMTVAQVYSHGLDIIGINAGIDPLPGETNHKYGDFLLGTAYREHYGVGLTHPGETMDQTCTAEITAWMLQALVGKSESEAWAIAAISNQTYLGVELFSGVALLFSFISTIFLALILLKSKFFESIKQPMPERITFGNQQLTWWIFAVINTALAGLFFVLFSTADLDWNFATNAPDLKMGVVNNWLGFFLTSAAAGTFFILLLLIIFNAKKRGSITTYDLGMTYSTDKFMANLKNKAHWQIFGKTALLAGILFGWMYLLVSIFTAAFMIEFRIFWAFAKPFTDERFIQFLLYLPIFLPFFLVNGGVFLFGELRQKESSTSFKTHFYWWLRILFTMVFGLLVVLLIQYVGVLFGNYPFYAIPTDWMFWMKGAFNPIMPIQLMAMIPLSAILYFIMLFFYRKTGKIYLGSIFATIITVWFFTVGSVVGAAL